MSGWWIAMWAAVASVPEDVQVRPFAATKETLERFARWQREHGSTPVAPLCQPLVVPEIQLCFRVWEGDRRRWVTAADGARWGVTPELLERHVRGDCAEYVARAEGRVVEGDAKRYVLLADGDGWAVGGFLCPDALRGPLSGATAFRAALPAEGVLLAWPAGDLDLDRIMAVAAREIAEGQPNPLTPQVMHYDGARWQAYGRAVPR